MSHPGHREGDAILGFEAQVPLEEGLRRTVEWVRERRAAEGAAQAEVA